MIEINKDNYDKEIRQNKDAVIMDFWAPWCGMCRKIKSIVEQIELEDSSIKIASINTEENQELVNDYAIVGLPTIIIMKDNKEIARYSGALSKKTLVDIIKGEING